MRFKTTQNILDKEFEIIHLDGILADTLGEPESNGIWLIYGAEKMGKTTFSLILANALSKVNKKVAYIMAEQGFDRDFQAVIKRLAISPKNKDLLFQEYVPLEDLDYTLRKKRAPDIIFLDNITVYVDELKYGKLRKLQKDHPNKLFIFLAHEENGLPYTSTAKLAKKLAKRIVHIEGNRAYVDGRGPGGMMNIDWERAQLYHGTN